MRYFYTIVAIVFLQACVCLENEDIYSGLPEWTPDIIPYRVADTIKFRSTNDDSLIFQTTFRDSVWARSAVHSHHEWSCTDTWYTFLERDSTSILPIANSVDPKYNSGISISHYWTDGNWNSTVAVSMFGNKIVLNNLPLHSNDPKIYGDTMTIEGVIYTNVFTNRYYSINDGSAILIYYAYPAGLLRWIEEDDVKWSRYGL